MKLNAINLFFQLLNAKKLLKETLFPDASSINLAEIYSSAEDIMNFDTHDPETLDNKEFIIAWGLARQKSSEVKMLIELIMTMKDKYKVTDFDFALLLEGFNEKDLFGN